MTGSSGSLKRDKSVDGTEKGTKISEFPSTSTENEREIVGRCLVRSACATFAMKADFLSPAGTGVRVAKKVLQMYSLAISR